MSTTSPHLAALSTPERLTSPTPGGRWLSNGNYTVLLTRAGTGFSRASGYALTRWNPDRIEDRTGLFFFVRDAERGSWFSVGEEPAGGAAESREFRTSPGRVTLVRRGDGLETRLDACVLDGRDGELRRLTVTNTGDAPRRLDVTSWADVVLNHPAADASHPAFSKLFVQTEWDFAGSALLARRRPRGNDERHPWLVHALLEEGAVSFESDRVRFVGRAGSPGAPRAMRVPGALGGSSGNVLDPVVALRRDVLLPPGRSATFTFVLALAPGREEALGLVRELREADAADAAFAAAEAAELTRRATCRLSDADADGLQALAAAAAYGYSGLRGPRASQARQLARPGLRERLELAADRALYVAWCENGSSAARVAELERACRYWDALGHACQAVALLAPNSVPPAARDARVFGWGELDPADADALAAQASAWFAAPLHEVAGEVVALETPRRAPAPRRMAAERGPAPTEPLREWNGFGGFSADGREYVIRMPYVEGEGHRRPPLPWVNIMASERFGFLVSETGAASTWSMNSREHRLTPWHNDPVLDPHGEALWVRDDSTGDWWSPCAGPSPAAADYEVRHGFGRTISRHESHGLAHETCWFAHPDEPVRVTRVRLENRSGRPRRLSLWSYARLVQGVLPEVSARHVVTRPLDGADAVAATNVTAGEFAHGVAFSAAVVTAGAAVRHASTDREEFLGVGGDVSAPQAVVSGAPLSGACGAGLDPCFAEQLVFELAPGEAFECAFLLGEGDSEAHASAIVRALREPGAVAAALAAASARWEALVSGVQVRTPSPEIDLMVNGWLAYQTLSCRIWGRTAYYQSGGAYGFRDQLQDAASLLHLRPELARAQIVLHANHQFVEGDVLHWWHPPLSKGMRTRFADDLLWLPLLATYYVSATGDWSVFDERARFLSAPPLREGEDEVYLVPRESGQAADVYEHCCRAIDRSLGVGAHGLPLFGTGDWNDGMNRVGREGRGESVWMGFFLHDILGRFAAVCERRGDAERAERYGRHREALRSALEEAGWDGEWYRRAYYDDGTPLGTKQGDECRIDGLAQAWSVLSGAASRERAEQAMDSVERHLVSERDGIIRLLTPAFRDTPHDPGYIKGYVAGVRENGGQYTHGVLWVVRAMAELGRRDRAAELLAMLSPVRHTASAERVARYQTEPYVIVADVYGEDPHVGRGGWTWYTGSAGWMLRIAIESVLGLTLEDGRHVRLKPCVPDTWPGFEMDYRVPGGDAVLEIRVSNPSGCSEAVVSARLDGEDVAPGAEGVVVPAFRDGRHHRLEITLGRRG